VIILDTNVLSEALKPSPNETVLGWLAAQNRDIVFTTAVTQAEILYGVEVLPAGKRRTRLRAAVERLFAGEFQERVLPFDVDSALAYAKIVAGRESAARPISQFDAVIASICRSRHATLATRNTSDFEHCGIRVINPWDGS
jgi:predicted nucleic acid-binding protein